MLNRVISFSLRNRLAVILMTLALIVGGIFAFTRLPIDAVPDITNNQVQVLTSAPALSPLEIERFVTTPLELSLKSLPNIVELRSLSRSGISVITIVFGDEVDPFFARQQVHERLAEAVENLPSTSGKPELAPISTGLGEIFRYVVKDTTGRLSPMDLRTVQDWIVRKQLQGVPGLAEINSLGGEVKQVHVLVNPVSLAGYRITLKEVYEAVSRNSGNAGGAYIEDGVEQYNVRAVGLAIDLKDLRSAVVKTTPTGIPITLDQVSTIEFGPALRFGSASQDGKGEVVTGITMQLKGANSRITVRGVKARIEEIKGSLPPGVVIEPYYDREELVDRTLTTVEHNLLEGALFVIAVLLLFLANLRAGLILASVIPLTMLFAVILMVLTGQSGNLMSLGAIDFGLVVDGSLIIVESCLRLISKHLEGTNGRKLSDREASELIFSGSSEVLQAAKFGVLIIILVYLPILTLQGVEGKFFRPMALTVSFALIGALILSVTYVPMMSFYFLQRKGQIKESKIIDYLRKLYLPLLRRSFRLRKSLLAGIAALLILALIMFSRLGGEFIPRLDEGDLSISLVRLPSISLSESQKLASEVERRIMKFEEVKTVVSHTGRAEISTDPMGVESSDVFVILHPKEQWKTHRTKAELLEAMNNALSGVPGIGTQFLQPIEMRMNELIAGVKGDVAIKIFGSDFSVLNPAAQNVARILRSVKGSADVSVEQTTGLPELVIQADRAMIARYGLSIEDVNDVVTTAIGGKKAGEIFEGERRSDIVVRYASPARGSLEAIKAIQVPAANGKYVILSSIAAIRFEDAPAQISREDGSRFITIQSNVRARDVQGFVTEVQQRVSGAVKLPVGYTIHYGGQFENLQAASKRLQLVVPLSLLLIFLLLYQTFKSVKLGLMIFLCVPLAAIGGIAGLLIAGLPFSISAGVGFIALFGIAVLNGIVMLAAIRKHEQFDTVVEFNAHRNVNEVIMDAIFRGSEERFRPVVTTAALAGLGFLPMLLANGAGAEVQRPLATVIIGGLVSSTLLTLFVVPLVYQYLGVARQTRVRKNASAPITSIMALAFVVLLPNVRVANGQSIGLKQLIERAISRSPEILGNEYLRDRDRALRSATSVPSPEVFYAIDERSAIVNGKSSFGISQSFEFPLVYPAIRRVRDLTNAQSELRLELAHRAVVREVTLAYLDARTDRELLEQADSNLAHTLVFVKITQLKREAGETNALESLQAQISLAESRRQRSDAAINYQQSIRRLQLVALVTSTDSITLIDSVSIATGVDTVYDSGIVPVPDSTISVNLQVRMASIGVDAARAGEEILRYQLFPSFTLEGSIQTVDGVGGYFGASVRLGLPFWRWLNAGERNAAVAQTAALDAERNALSIQIRAALLDAQAQYNRAVVTERQLKEELLPKAQEAYQIVLRLKQLGEANYLALLTVQRSLVEAETDRIHARLQKEQAIVSLNYLIGRL
jgi:cobalt-zinc-cadmium resistance protein CzcA